MTKLHVLRVGGLLAVATLLHVANAAAQERTSHVLRGTVTDTVGRPVPYANVWIGSGRPVVTDDTGGFRIASHSGRVAVNVRRLGFKPL